jgi:hypothetical protein
MFDNIDNQFFEIILLNKHMFNDVMTKSLEYDLDITKDIVELKTPKIKVEHNGKKTEKIIILFGEYNLVNNIFGWIGESNDLFIQQLERYDVKKIFGSYRTLDKILKKEFKISEKYHIAIPYLMAILNPAFNIVSFKTPNSTYIYALVNLGIKDNFNFEKFIKNMQKYKNLAIDGKKSKNIIKKSKNIILKSKNIIKKSKNTTKNNLNKSDKSNKNK